MNHKIKLNGLSLIQKQNVINALKKRYRWNSSATHPSQLAEGEWMVWRNPSDRRLLYAYYKPLETETMITVEDIELLSSVRV